MDQYSFYPLVVAVFLFLLGFTSFHYGQRKKEQIVFIIYAGLSGFGSLTDFMYHFVGSDEAKIIWLKAGILSGFLMMSVSFFFILLLSGNLNRLDKKVFGIPFRWHLFLISSYLLSLFALIVFSNLVIFWPAVGLAGVNGKIIGPFYYLLMFELVLLTLLILFLLHDAIKTATSPAKRQVIFFSILSITLLYLAVTLLSFYPNQTILRLFSTFIPLSTTFLFHLGIVRSQILEINALNSGLEVTVAERTQELREMQTQLVQTERLAASADLVAGIVHHIHSPLGAMISANNTLLRAAGKLKNALHEEIPELIEKSERLNSIFDLIEKLTQNNCINGGQIRNILKNLKSFTHLDEAQMQIVNLNDAIETTLLFLAHRFLGRVIVNKEYGKLDAIRCQPQLINQMFAYILLNAMQSIDESGEIKIITKMNDQHAMVQIADNGTGIPAEYLNQIFDAGFTSRKSPKHAGMGLALTQQIISKHKGHIKVESKPGEGTKVTIQLPKDLQNI